MRNVFRNACRVKSKCIFARVYKYCVAQCDVHFSFTFFSEPFKRVIPLKAKQYKKNFHSLNLIKFKFQLRS